MNYTMLAHDPAVAAERAAESIRELNYMASDICDSSGVCEVLGGLASMVEQLPESCAQMTGWLEREAGSGRLRAGSGPPLQEIATTVPKTVRLATDWLSRAAALAEQLHQALRCAHVTVGGLAHTDAFHQPELDLSPCTSSQPFPQQHPVTPTTATGMLNQRLIPSKCR
jgi:hypothetical protein